MAVGEVQMRSSHLNLRLQKCFQKEIELKIGVVQHNSEFHTKLVQSFKTVSGLKFEIAGGEGPIWKYLL